MYRTIDFDAIHRLLKLNYESNQMELQYYNVLFDNTDYIDIDNFYLD